ncbi:CLUMA_CG002801, isoform A [Clunio marinus]|uniref:CLUMA_CG002801, isoform A n=1 Tax=Clunio marinus TaxID=568069 RepID=A0A1J1HL44_9DIPT|nr:CLUMA_CG002842, isoform A [Clunio marinus]CRK88784.1 CLUMA_CG002801, isoform A [Clunio marinus]
MIQYKVIHAFGNPTVRPGPAPNLNYRPETAYITYFEASQTIRQVAEFGKIDDNILMSLCPNKDTFKRHKLTVQQIPLLLRLCSH